MGQLAKEVPGTFAIPRKSRFAGTWLGRDSPKGVHSPPVPALIKELNLKSPSTILSSTRGSTSEGTPASASSTYPPHTAKTA